MSRTLLAVGLLLLVLIGVQAASPGIEHGDYEPMGQAVTYDQYLTEGVANEIGIFVTVNPDLPERRPQLHRGQDLITIEVPELGPKTDRYGVQVRASQHDIGLDPLVLWAEPGRGGERIEPDEQREVLSAWDALPITERGIYRLVTSTERGSGDIDLELRIVAAEPRPALGFLAGDLAKLAAGIVLIASLAISLVLYTQSRRIPPADQHQRSSARTDRRDEVDLVHDGALDPGDDDVPRSMPVPRNLPVGVNGFGRMEPRLAGVREWETDEPGLPERLAEREGRGWIIRID